MSVRTIVQLFLVLILFLMTYFFIEKYFAKDNKKNSISINKKTEKVFLNTDQNLIKDIEYNSTNNNDYIFTIKADFGEVSKENSNKIFMTNVRGVVNKVEPSNLILIFSDFAKFDNQTFETNFIDNVKIFTKNELIKGDNLYLVFDHKNQKNIENLSNERNLIRLKGNIQLNKLNYNLKADVVEINLDTNDTKIFMYDSDKKVKIQNIVN
jgi:lipopolysaccharide export system protein LptA